MVRIDMGVWLTCLYDSGAFPGASIEARSGDRLVIDVQNSLEDEGIAFHWHGLHMRGKYFLHLMVFLLIY